MYQKQPMPSMPPIVKILRVAADPSRLRILLLLKAEELSVAELQEILTMGQSTISTHLSQLKQAGLVEDRRTGKSSLYRLAAPSSEVVRSPDAPPVLNEHVSSHAETSPSALKGHDSSRTETSPSVLKGHDSSRTETAPSVLKGYDSSRTESAPAALKRHDSSRAETAPAVLKRHDSSRTESAPAVLKGHDFSRAENGPFKGGPLGPEGSSSGFSPASTQAPGNLLDELLLRAAAEIPEAAQDRAEMRRVVRKRQDRMRSFFDSVAGRLGRNYVPGKSWKSIAEALLRLLPPLTIADLGTGEGSFALLLAQRAQRVIAVDSSARMLEVGREQAARNGVRNIEFRLGDMEELPIANGEVELVFFSQSLHHVLHPGRALAEAARILAPGGRIVVLDLARHRFEEAREIYADEWLGFSEAELEQMLAAAGFAEVEASIVDKESEPPQFQTVLAVATRPE
jgi:ubiquinone/menaquinone biosynthesis C-methylase UbiE/DNA-binding transcriptional ArsR family regulator